MFVKPQVSLPMDRWQGGQAKLRLPFGEDMELTRYGRMLTQDHGQNLRNLLGPPLLA